jgi:hypothetical protein
MGTATYPLTYEVTLTESGEWFHAEGSDFLFAYVDNSWPEVLKKQVGDAFKQALEVSSLIKKAVLDTSGQKVENGLYLLDQNGMTAAMNAIPGMGETSVDSNEESGSGTAVSINAQFFTSILAGLSGDVAPILGYLNNEMGGLQAQTQQSEVTSTFGTVIGLVSAIEELEDVVTTFEYAFSSAQTAEWFTSVPCGSEHDYSYDYKYQVVRYNYLPPSD